MEIGGTNAAAGSNLVNQDVERLGTSALDQAGLDRDAFLRIFLTQLENQDPLSPQDTSELSAQLAQFSQLEQALRTNDELVSVNEKLDQLLRSSGRQQLADLDPVRLIGREVEIEGESLRIPAAGASAPLRIQLDRAVQLLQIQALDPAGASLGVLQLAPQAGSELPPGTYELTLVDGAPFLRAPGGSAVARPFFGVDAEGNRVEAVFEPGATYTFAVGASDLSGAPIIPLTTTGGRVDAVSNQPEGTRLSVDGVEVDFSKIIRIR